MSHFIEKCECGITLAQCRCPDPNKTVKIKKPCNHKVLQPMRYKAQTLPPEIPDPFVGYKTHEVTGYYVKHIWATPNPIGTKEQYEEFVNNHTKHYIVSDGFSDWNLPRQMEVREIDIKTLQEVRDNG